MPPELRESFFGAEMEISVADTHRRPAFEYGSEPYQNPVFASAYLEQQRFEPMNIAGHAAPLEMPISNTAPGSVGASPQSFECGIGSYSSVLSVLSYGSPPRLSSEDTHPNITLPGSSTSSPVPSASATMKPRDKKLPACLFCRKRKIACALALGVCRGAMNAQAQCNQCYRRRLDCVYPTERQRGTKKKQLSTLTRTAVESQVSTNGGDMDTMREPLSISFVMPLGSIVRTTSGSSDRGEMEHGKDGA
ncbi:hypothetical protein B0H14DRAFT_3137546 [Mycena olivaceomarginata]|nr:hypothetical protein B0H14DRAFT_3137546 [Mycena olivaceomarginata]